MTHTDAETTIRQVLDRYAGLESASVEPLSGGLINETFCVSHAGKRKILQRVSAIFDPRIHCNIEAVTRHLSDKGFLTPLLVKTSSEELFVQLASGDVWRLMTFVEGESLSRIDSLPRATEAGRLVGRFHQALCDLKHDFVGGRVGVHDTDAHLAELARVTEAFATHPLHADVERLSRAIFDASDKLPGIDTEASLVGHGDLKLSNLMFGTAMQPTSPRGLCLVDLDTVGPIALAHELGDAFRSWCNPAGEDAPEEVRFDVNVFEAALVGYASGLGRSLTDREQQAAVMGVEWISLELCARFASDALREDYFGFDAERFASRGHHNLHRATAQWRLYQSACEHRHARQRLARSLVG